MKKIFLLFVSLICFVTLEHFFLSGLSDETKYYHGFKSYFEKLKETYGQDRIILLGGSSLGWGVSAKKLTDSLDVLTLNGGMGAGIGYQRMFDLSEEFISKKDLLVISPEYLLPNETSMRTEQYCYVKTIVLGDFDFYCVGYITNNVMRIGDYNPDRGHYISSGFNGFGDYVFRLESEKNMEGEIRSNELCENIQIGQELDDYIKYFEKLRDRGYEILYIPTLIAQSACSNETKIREFHKKLDDKFGLKTFDNVRLTLDDKYFYDTIYHLTHDGVEIKTKRFLAHLSQYEAYKRNNLSKKYRSNR